MATQESISVRFSYRKKPLPPIEELFAEANRLYAYDKDAKGLIWKGHKNPKRPWPLLGSVAGGDDGHGYRMCLVLGHKFKVHQIVWLLEYGYLPSQGIDHKDRDKRNNSTENLRPASDLDNIQNISTAMTPAAGTKVARGRTSFQAIVQYRGKKHYFGSFKTVEEAHLAYLKGKHQLCGSFAPS